jgi:acyl-coenzyme A synthetase/AMP-(fatty) acid ligase
MHALPFLAESAVVALPSDGFEGSTICCAYVSSAAAKIAPANVRKELARLIPGYMLPSRWLVLAELPKNQNGKVDRKALRELLERAPRAGGG